jgi:DeoR family transcriptional regulator, suf operon transcriptional repressor
MPNATISAAGLRVVKLLVGSPPRSVNELLRAAGVTRTAVTAQLNDLIEAGLVERATERLVGRGRPRHLYKATDAALVLLFSSNQKLVAPVIWRAIREVGGDELIGKVVKRVSRALAEHYNRKITAKKPLDRLRQFIRLLTDEGGLVEATEKGGRLVLYKRSCPFISMVDKQRSVCHIDREVLVAVVGRPVRQIACRHEGDPCCTFEIAND